MSLPRFFAAGFLLLLAAAAEAATFTDAAPPPALQRDYRATPFRFGYLTVPENRANPARRNIQLAVVILKAQTPAATPTPASRPVFFLTGGPGGSATSFGAFFAVFPALQRTRDVVLIDQRGAGYSEPFLGIRGGTFAAVRARFVGQGVDLTAYNTTENAADIADLRVALGYDEIVLFGNSYGSFLAQEVMRSHPAGIAAVVLNGVVPATDTFIPSFNRNTRHGLRELFRDVQRTGPARRAFPQFSRTYFDLLERLSRRPKRLDDGFRVTLEDFQSTVLALLQSPERIRLIPLLTREITAGRGSEWARDLLDNPESRRDFSLGMYLSTLGADWNQPGWLGLTRRADRRLRPEVFRAANSPSSLSVVFGVRAWEVPFRPQATRTPLQSPIPTLLLAGNMEAQTPPNGARLVAAGLPNSFSLAYPRSGHITGMTPGPALLALLQFVDNPLQPPAYRLGELRRPNFYATRVPSRSARLRGVDRGIPFVR